MTEPAAVQNRNGWRIARIVALAAVVVSVAVGAVFGSRIGQDPTLVESPLIGQPAPDVTLSTARGFGHRRVGGSAGADRGGQLLGVLVHPLP